MDKIKRHKILITGLSGTGKTYLTDKLKSYGVNAFDADEMPELAAWYDKSGTKVDFPKNASSEWLDSHEWLWDKEVLRSWLATQEGCVLFGISSNWHLCLELFDKAFCLTLSEEELRKRLRSNTRDNPFGKTQDQEDRVVEAVKNFEKFVKRYNITLIDAARSPEVILKEITEYI